MSAAAVIAAKDWRELVRDGRAVGAVALVLLIGLVALWLSAQGVARAEAERVEAAQRDRATWLSQGAANPHSVAHFATWAFKPKTALTVFEPGVTPYLGEAIWMEAHSQDPAKFRPAEDATEARRFADLSPAWAIMTVLPLAVIGLGFAALAREREGGQWRQLAASGVPALTLLAGKARVLLSVGLALAAAVAVPALLAAQRLPAPPDAGARWALTLLTVALYAAAVVAVTLTISAAARTTRGALLGLIAFWMLTVVLMPRLAATVTDAVAPTPSVRAFWDAVHADMDEGEGGREARAKRVEAATLARYGVARLEDLPVNFSGIALQASEEYGNRVFDRHFGALERAYDRQQAALRWVGLLSPAIAFRNATAAFAGTDAAHHWHFAGAAEAHRRVTIEQLNADMIRNAGRRDFDYQADPRLWATIPEFAYAAPRWTIARGAWLDLAILGAWVAAGAVTARMAVRRWRAA